MGRLSDSAKFKVAGSFDLWAEYTWLFQTRASDPGSSLVLEP